MRMLSTWIIIISWLAFLGFWGVLALRAKRDKKRFGWEKWLRIALFIVLALSILRGGRIGQYTLHMGLFSIHGVSALRSYIAAILTAAGIGFAIWARLHLGRNWSSSPALKEDHELITSGPYKLVRHPIYTGMLLAVVGSAFLNLGWLFILAFALITFLIRVKTEEGIMTREFPQAYPEYKKRTWALVPFVY